MMEPRSKEKKPVKLTRRCNDKKPHESSKSSSITCVAGICCCIAGFPLLPPFLQPQQASPDLFPMFYGKHKTDTHLSYLYLILPIPRRRDSHSILYLKSCSYSWLSPLPTSSFHGCLCTSRSPLLIREIVKTRKRRKTSDTRG